MKKIFFLIISVLSFQTLSLADNIQYFQVEGMRIGDSALNYSEATPTAHNTTTIYIKTMLVILYEF